MSIVLPKGLPAQDTLAREGIDVRDRDAADDRMRPGTLRIALLNLMPMKPVTETQFARLLGAGPYDVELTLLLPDGYMPKSVPAAYLHQFYRRWSEVREATFDGLIVTGAPVETLPFQEVAYWRQLARIFDWSQTHVAGSFHICWAAQAALHHFHGVPKHALARKAFGVYRHRVRNWGDPLMRGFGAELPIPVSRHTEVRAGDLPRGRGITVLAESPETGLALLADRPRHAYYMFNHLEYDGDTLAREYRRDVAAGKPVDLPANYFPDDDPTRDPPHTWRAAARLVFRNWLAELHGTHLRAAA
jgi:homoserine O-succinyltransferase